MRVGDYYVQTRRIDRRGQLAPEHTTKATRSKTKAMREALAIAAKHVAGGRPFIVQVMEVEEVFEDGEEQAAHGDFEVHHKMWEVEEAEEAAQESELGPCGHAVAQPLN